MLIVISEKQAGTLLVKKYKGSDVVNHLQPVQPPQQQTTLLAPPANPNKAHLDSMGIVQVFARTDLSEQDYKQYLDSTPPGLSPRNGTSLNSSSAGLTAFVWEQAKKENPKPQLLLPVPLVGVKGTRSRMDVWMRAHGCFSLSLFRSVAGSYEISIYRTRGSEAATGLDPSTIA